MNKIIILFTIILSAFLLFGCTGIATDKDFYFIEDDVIDINSLDINGFPGTIPFLKDNNTFIFSPDFNYKNSTKTLNVNNINTSFIDFNLLNGYTMSEGRLQWDSNNGTLMFGLPGGNVNLQIGQETVIRVKNNSGSPILDGSVVYITGATGQRATIGCADADNYNTSFVLGVATETINDNHFGYVTLTGAVNDINTIGTTEGSPIWLSQTACKFTSTRPSAPAMSVFVGYTTYTHATEGKIVVRPVVVPRLSGLSDVNDTGKLDEQILYWDEDTNTYRTKSLDLTGYVPYIGATTDLNLGYNDFDLNGTINASSSYGDEKVNNGTFTGSSNYWNLGDGWTFSVGRARKSADGLGTLSQADINLITPIVPGEYYTLSFMMYGQPTDIVGNVTVTAAGLNLGTFNKILTSSYSITFRALSNAPITFTPDTTTSRFGIDSVSLRKTSGIILGGTMELSGTNGGTITQGAGTRLSWIPYRGALRAGTVTGTQWSDINIGNNSVAFGLDNRASSDRTIAMGWLNDVNTINAMGFGYNNKSYGNGSILIGFSNQATGTASVGLGIGTRLSGFGSIGIGYGADSNNIIAGTGVIDAKVGQIVMGYASIGKQLKAEGTASIAMGQDVMALTNDNVIGIGKSFSTSDRNSFSVGFGKKDFQILGDYNLGIFYQDLNINRDLNVGRRIYATSDLNYSQFGSSTGITGFTPIDGTDRIYATNISNKTSGSVRAGFFAGLYNGSDATTAIGVQGINAFAMTAASTTANLTLTNNGGGLRNRYAASHYGSGLVSMASGISSLVNAFGGNMTEAAAFRAENPTINSGKTVTDYINYYVEGGSTSGTITNHYGLKINSLTSGTNKYGIYVQSDKSYFGEDINVNADTFTNYLNITGKNLAYPSHLAPLEVHQETDLLYWTALFYNDVYSKTVPIFSYYGYDTGKFGMGTEVDTDLAFYTNGYTNERMVIKNNGNVLIGTSTDDGNKLLVNGSISGGDIWSNGVKLVNYVDNDSNYRTWDNNVFAKDLNVKQNLYVDGNYFGNQIYGEDYNKLDGGFETVDLVTPDVYVRVRKLGAGSLNGFTVSDGNLIAQYSGMYLVNTKASVSVAVAGEVGMKVFVNDTGKDNCYSHQHLSGNVYDMMITCLVRLNAGENINIRFDDHMNPVSDVVIDAMNVNATRIGN